MSKTTESEQYRCPFEGCRKEFDSIRSAEAHVSGSKNDLHSGWTGQDVRDEIENDEVLEDDQGLVGRAKDRVSGLFGSDGTESNNEQSERADRDSHDRDSRPDRRDDQDDEWDEAIDAIRASILTTVAEDEELRRALASRVIDDLADEVTGKSNSEVQPETNVSIDSPWSALAWNSYHNPDRAGELVGSVSENLGESLGEGLRRGLDLDDLDGLIGGASQPNLPEVKPDEKEKHRGSNNDGDVGFSMDEHLENPQEKA